MAHSNWRRTRQEAVHGGHSTDASWKLYRQVQLDCRQLLKRLISNNPHSFTCHSSYVAVLRDDCHKMDIQVYTASLRYC
jgi:hypothetical protein